ncbi:MAG TPA: hypothetical protein ENN34_12140 [Deltaproteobacteria bacterium]|nr:hypothetical protein [Deltaproteobacteria bacterium]
MKRVLCCSLMFMLLVPALSSARAMEITVEISGPGDLVALKPGIENTVLARCISRHIPLEEYSKLAISISALGNVISFDAILDTIPPRAFHKDLQGQAEISPAIDEMIETLFAAERTPAPHPQKREASAVPHTKEVTIIRLPFEGTALLSHGGTLLVSDRKAVYRLAGEKPERIWKSPGNSTIARLYAYKDSVLVLTELRNTFTTYSILGTTQEKWTGAVVPFESGFVSMEPKFDSDIAPDRYRWSRVTVMDGSPPELPEGLDPLSLASVESSAAQSLGELASFTLDGSLAIAKKGVITWSSETDHGFTPFFIEEKRKQDTPVRYYLRPRILSGNGMILTFKNDQGLASFLKHTISFTGAEILSYTCGAQGCEKRVLQKEDSGYCADITLHNGVLYALLVKKKASTVTSIAY